MNKRSLLLFIGLAVASVAYGQFPNGGGHGGDMPKRRPAQMTPKQIAERRTEMMERELGLTEKQTNKVYKINLQQANKQQSPTATRNSSMSAGPEGMGGRSGSMRGGMGGGMGGPGGGMRGGMGGSGGGMPGDAPQMNGQRPSGPPPAMADGGFGEESEKEIAKREKKMKKILDSGQYARWHKMENEYRKYQMREHFSRNLPMPGQL